MIDFDIDKYEYFIQSEYKAFGEPSNPYVITKHKQTGNFGALYLKAGEHVEIESFNSTFFPIYIQERTWVSIKIKKEYVIVK